MNTFVEEFKKFERVTYYTIRKEGEEHSCTDDLLIQLAGMEEKKEELDQLLEFIEKLGNQVGAQARYFRPEGSFHALPGKPHAARQLIASWEFNTLRLLCLRLSSNVVVLYGGGVKTTRTAQESFGKAFRDAARYTKAIDEKLLNGEWVLNHWTRLLEPVTDDRLTLYL